MPRCALRRCRALSRTKPAAPPIPTTIPQMDVVTEAVRGVKRQLAVARAGVKATSTQLRAGAFSSLPASTKGLLRAMTAGGAAGAGGGSGSSVRSSSAAAASSSSSSAAAAPASAKKKAAATPTPAPAPAPAPTPTPASAAKRKGTPGTARSAKKA